MQFEDCRFDCDDGPQAKYWYSTDIIEYIRYLNADKDIALFKKSGCDITD